ncbi:MAG TPA: hypothetical protein VGD56_21000 [Gemmatirosa sp.]
MSPLTALQIESWRLLRDEWVADAAAQAEWRAWEAGRTRARPEIADLAAAFLAGALDAEALRAAFDRETRTRWDVFGLRGVAGAMFLNRLAKHVRETPLRATLDPALRAALRVPPTVVAAGAQLAAFADYVRTAGPAAQPALATAFVSAWWHAQDPLHWPSYQPSTRQTLAAEEGVFVPTGDPVVDYVTFRAAALALGVALGLHPWALEHLCWWQQHRDPSRVFADAEPARAAWPVADEESDAGAAGGDARTTYALGAGPGRPPTRVAEPAPVCDWPAATDEAGSDAPDAVGHTHTQWLLARLGRRLGCRVWVAANDHHRAWRGERLGALSVDRLPPLGLDPDSQRLVELIDVVWLRGASQVVAAFEVECTTSVHGGLLRMADLAALAPNLAVPLYVVVPEERLAKVRRELRRPALQALDLHRRCGFFSTEALAAAAPEIARWASGPEAIGRLAERLDAERSETPRREER